MPGTYQYDVEIKSNVAKLLSDMKQVQDRLDTVEGKEYKIKLNVDEKKLSSVISNLEKMLDSLGKGTGDFKQFENLSKQLSSITTDIGKISKAFATMDDGSGLVNNIKSIDSSLTNLTNHFVLQVSDKMASSIKEVKGTLSDVGDGKELTPLLNTIGRIESAIDKLSSSVKGIGLNMNIDLGSDKEMEAKAESKISNALQAYQRLFEHIKMSSAGGSIINTKFFDFDINQYDTAMSKLQAYRKFIENMRNEAKAMYGGQDVLFADTDKKYWTQASSAMGQVTKTFNEMKAASDTNPLENIFGKTDLTEVLNQLSAIVSKLDEISMSANKFADVFKDGLNVNASVEEIEKLTNRVRELESELAKIKTLTTVAVPQESNISSGKKFQDFQKEQANYEESINKVNSAIQKTDKILDTLPLHDKLDSQFLDMIDSVDNLNSKLKSGQLTLSEYKNEVKSVTSEYSKMIDIQQKRDVEEYNAAANLRKTKTNQFKKIDDKFSKYSKQYTSLENSPAGYQHNDKYKAELEEYNNQLKAIKVKIQAIKDQDIDVVDQKDLSELDKMYAKLDKINNSLSHIPATQKGSTKESRQKVFNMINELKQFTGMARESKLELEAMEQRFKSLGTNLNVSEAISEVKAFKSQLVATNQTTKNLLDTVKEKAWYGWAAQLAGMFSFYDVINGFRQVTSTVIDLNTQITDLAKVSEATSSQIYDDFNSYADIAKDIGGTISDTISATADWSRNGYNIPDSKELARVALLYKNVGDGIDIDVANESLISTLRGFKMEADEAEKIIDIFNNVSNNEPIDSGGIGEALQRSAASFNAANTSLQESVALISTTNSVIQNPEKVGNMWKVVSMRIRSATSELEQAGEDTDGLVTSTADLQKMIKAMTGYDILESDGKTFKSIYDIVLNISKVWNNLSDLDQSSLLQALAGKQQSNALAAALSNPELLEKSYQEAMDSAGSAAEEEKKYQQSVQYSIDQTKAKLEELSADLLSSDFLKGAIDAGGKFIDVLDGIVKSGSAIPAVATAISAALSFKNVGRVKIVALM